MKTNMQKGVTMIALVVTIMVLLILSGITLASLSGDNGMINKANSTKQNAEKKQWEEEIEIVLMQVRQNKVDPTLEDVKKAIVQAKIVEKEEDIQLQNGKLIIKTKQPQYTIEIDWQ